MTESQTLFFQSWQRAWHALGLEPSADLLPQLLAAYSEPQRHYHTLQHLGECLQRFEETQQLATPLAMYPGEVEVALWFHDAIYALKGKDNELRSAQWASEALSQSGASDEQVRRVHALIMATCHSDEPPQKADAMLLTDIDLAILGASPERFAEYDAQVSAEYSWVPRLIYGFKRKQVLQAFLKRESIYSTAHFQQLLEQQARSNLRAQLDI